MPIKWKADDTVVLSFCIFGFGGGLAELAMHSASIIVGLLLGTGVASLLYRFLGGVNGATFTLGALKLTGTAAVLLGVTVLVDSKLRVELPSSAKGVFTNADMVGTWRWVYGAGGWTGELDFQLDDKAKLIFSGLEKRCSDPTHCEPAYNLTNGHADIVSGGLELNVQVHDYLRNSDFVLKTTQPLSQTLGFEGNLRIPGATMSDPWGMSLYRPKN